MPIYKTPITGKSYLIPDMSNNPLKKFPRRALSSAIKQLLRPATYQKVLEVARKQLSNTTDKNVRVALKNNIEVLKKVKEHKDPIEAYSMLKSALHGIMMLAKNDEDKKAIKALMNTLEAKKKDLIRKYYKTLLKDPTITSQLKDVQFETRTKVIHGLLNVIRDLDAKLASAERKLDELKDANEKVKKQELIIKKLREKVKDMYLNFKDAEKKLVDYETMKQTLKTAKLEVQALESKVNELEIKLDMKVKELEDVKHELEQLEHEVNNLAKAADKSKKYILIGAILAVTFIVSVVLLVKITKTVNPLKMISQATERPLIFILLIVALVSLIGVIMSFRKVYQFIVKAGKIKQT